MADVFVSYSRRDSEFVGRVVESIEQCGKEAWLDTEGLVDGEVFPAAIRSAIEQADTFVFVISPAAVASPFCENEVSYAGELRKRIVPVLREPVPDAELPAEIRDRNWIPFTERDAFDSSMQRLLAALDRDPHHVHAHTRWLVKALEWDSEGRDRSFLLRGAELTAAEGWLASRPEDADPAPTQLQREYVLASREAAARRQRAMLSGAVVIAVVSVGLLVFALISRGQAVSERVSARAQALAAQSQAQLPTDPEISLILGMRAVREKPTAQSLFALRAALDASPLERALPTIPNPGTCAGGLSAAISPDGREIAEGTCTGLMRILDAVTGRVLRSNHIGVQVSSLAYSRDGDVLAAATGDGVWVIDPQTAGGVAWKGGVSTDSTSVAFSPNGHTLAASSGDGLAIGPVKGVTPGTAVSAPLGGNVVFSPDGRVLFAGGQDASVHVYDAATGRLIHRILEPRPVNPWVEVVAVSPNGRQLAVAYPVSAQNATSAVSIYSTSTWREQSTLMTLPDAEITALAFSPDGSRLAIGAFDGTAGVWSIPTKQELVSYAGPTAAINSIGFTPDGNSVLTASDDGIARIWRAVGVEQSFQILPLPDAPAQLAFDGNSVETVPFDHPVVFSTPAAGGHAVRRQTLPAGETVVLSGDGRFSLGLGTTASVLPRVVPLTIYDTRSHRTVRRLHVTSLPPSEGPQAVTFSWNDARVALVEGAATSGPIAVILSLATGKTVQLQNSYVACGSPPSSFAFSRNDRRVAAADFCGYADVWNAQTGRLLKQVNQGGEVSAVDLSADGSRLLVSSWDSQATIWNVDSGRRLVNLIGDTRGLEGAAFSPDGSLVATSSLDRTVRIWDARTGHVLRLLTFPDDQWPLAFNADGSELAVAENDPAPGAPDAVRVFDTCPACTNARGLLRLAAPHVTTQLTVLEKTVVQGS
jgi:WD40 repeat protein